jgi:hypothetical protein
MTMSESGWTLIDQELGVWQLLEREGGLYLQVRYSVGSAIDTAVLFPLDDDERAALDEGGYDYLAALARQVQSSGYPAGDESSPFHERDLYGGSAQTPERERLWDEVWAAIEGRQLHRAAGFRYPRSFELARRQAIGDPPYLDVDEARAAHAAGQALTVIFERGRIERNAAVVPARIGEGLPVHAHLLQRPRYVDPAGDLGARR